jgi:hypothetical protein
VTLTVVGFGATGATRIWDGGGANPFWLNPTNWLGNIQPAVFSSEDAVSEQRAASVSLAISNSPNAPARCWWHISRIARR